MATTAALTAFHTLKFPAAAAESVSIFPAFTKSTRIAGASLFFCELRPLFVHKAVCFKLAIENGDKRCNRAQCIDRKCTKVPLQRFPESFNDTQSILSQRLKLALIYRTLTSVTLKQYTSTIAKKTQFVQ